MPAMPEIPDVIRRAIEAQERATGGRISLDRVRDALAADDVDPIPSDADAIAEQDGDWRTLAAVEEPADLSDGEREMIQQSLPLSDGDGISGRYFGADATATERESGVEVELDPDRDDRRPIRPGSLAHQILAQYGGGERLTSYEASLRSSGDWHAKRRESTRLLVRGFLMKDGTKPNDAPSGRPHVDAYRITEAGLSELARLG